MRRRDMAGPAYGVRSVVVLIAAVLTTGCDGAASIGQTPTVEPSSRPFSVYTHCGVENVRIDGRWWHASPPLYNQERTGPPAGWGDPYQEGTLTVESADRVVFDALGRRVVLVPAPDGGPVRVCR